MHRGIVCIVLVLLSLLEGMADSHSATARHGQLQVIGTQLCNSRGKPIQLRGMSTHGLQWYGWDDKLSAASLDALSNDWKSDILRLSMYPDEEGYKSNPAHFRAMVDTLVDQTVNRGMYCILDWHILNPGDPLDNLDKAKEFFSYLSKKHGSKKRILYEICNEPNGKDVTWEKIKSYAEIMIPLIRLHDPDGIIIVGTPAWSSLGISEPLLKKEFLASPIKGSLAHNLLYSFHFYADPHQETYRTQFSSIAERLPIFVTEWGSQGESGDGKNNFESTQAWLDLLDHYQISACNWNYSDDKRSGAVWKKGTLPKGPFTDDQLKEAGLFVKKWIQAGSKD